MRLQIIESCSGEFSRNKATTIRSLLKGNFGEASLNIVSFGRNLSAILDDFLDAEKQFVSLARCLHGCPLEASDVEP